jgi:hypothetical protein
MSSESIDEITSSVIIFADSFSTIVLGIDEDGDSTERVAEFFSFSNIFSISLFFSTSGCLPLRPSVDGERDPKFGTKSEKDVKEYVFCGSEFAIFAGSDDAILSINFFSSFCRFYCKNSFTDIKYNINLIVIQNYVNFAVLDSIYHKFERSLRRILRD